MRREQRRDGRRHLIGRRTDDPGSRPGRDHLSPRQRSADALDISCRRAHEFR